MEEVSKMQPGTAERLEGLPEIAEMAVILAAEIEKRITRNFQVYATITLTEAAKQLDISEEKMRGLLTSGQIPYFRMDRQYRIKPSDLNDYLDRNYHPVAKKRKAA